MAAVTPTIKDRGFQNWLKGALALLFTKQGLDDFVDIELTEFQKDLLESIVSRNALSTGAVCNSCTTENVLPCPTSNFCPRGRKCTAHNTVDADRIPNRPCPKNICQNMRDEIRRNHICNVPSWTNTDAMLWCSDSFQLGKCYMPREGYSPVRTLAQTDFNGTLSVIINNKRFNNKMDADLKQPTNICSQARDVGRDIRHNADMSISDANLLRYINILVRLLSDATYLATDQKAQEAVHKLNQLQAHTLTITTEDVISILDDEFKAIVVRQRDETLQAIDKKNNEEQKKILDTIKDALHNMQTVSINNLDQIVEKKLNEIKAVADKEKENIKQLIAKGREQKEDVNKQKDTVSFNDVGSISDQSKLEKCLKEDLIHFYRKFHSMIPVSPIVEEHAVPLADFYVQPPLISVDVEKTFGHTKESRKPVHSFRDVFHHTDGHQYKDIYITSKAGVGKTSFAKKINMVWCQSHSPDEDLRRKFDPEDIQAMKIFEFLFMITLRDSNTSLCSLDDMIYSQVLQRLSRHRRYNEIFLEDVLQGKICLIVLDGLDEWSHPESCKSCFRSIHDLPHRAAREKSTILTTTRPWKFDFLRLSTNQIDRHVDISEFNSTTSKELASNAVTLLNKRSLSQQPKKVEEFYESTSLLVFDTVRYIPYILLQMVCLWFDGETIGNSKCEIYSNILELTFSRGLMKTGNQYWSSEHGHRTETVKSFPLCLQSNELCKDHYDLILPLGQIAFETLFCSRKESTIVFDDTVVLNRIPEYSLTFCLKMGLLSQHKECGKVASRRRTLSFQHKSVQEHLAALYLRSSFDRKDIRERIVDVCCTLPCVLEMSNTFIFLGGFSPEACGQILQILREGVSNDDTVRYYRENLLIKEYGLSQLWKMRAAIRSFQSMQVDIVKEINNSGHNKFPLYIEDIVVDSSTDTESYQLLKILVANNKSNIKSLYICDLGSTEEFTELLDAVGLQELHTLQKLVVIAVPRQHELRNLLSKSVQSLKCLRVSFVEYRNTRYYPEDVTLYNDDIRIISNIANLLALMLSNICISHDDVKTLFSTISGRTTMTEVGLYNITCNSHSHCSGEMLDLSKHQHMQTLNLDKIPVAELRVNSSSLNECLVGEDATFVFSSWFDSLCNATNLQSLWFRRMTPELMKSMSDKLSQMVNLRNFGIEITNLDGTILTLTPGIKIESVYLYKVDMPSMDLRRFVDSLLALPHAVHVTLERCSVTPANEYQELKGYIFSSSKYKVKLDGLNFRCCDQFEFETIVE